MEYDFQRKRLFAGTYSVQVVHRQRNGYYTSFRGRAGIRGVGTLISGIVECGFVDRIFSLCFVRSIVDGKIDIGQQILYVSVRSGERAVRGQGVYLFHDQHIVDVSVVQRYQIGIVGIVIRESQRSYFSFQNFKFAGNFGFQQRALIHYRAEAQVFSFRRLQRGYESVRFAGVPLHFDFGGFQGGIVKAYSRAVGISVCSRRRHPFQQSFAFGSVGVYPKVVVQTVDYIRNYSDGFERHRNFDVLTEDVFTLGGFGGEHKGTAAGRNYKVVRIDPLQAFRKVCVYRAVIGAVYVRRIDSPDEVPIRRINGGFVAGSGVEMQFDFGREPVEHFAVFVYARQQVVRVHHFGDETRFVHRHRAAAEIQRFVFAGFVFDQHIQFYRRRALVIGVPYPADDDEVGFFALSCGYFAFGGDHAFFRDPGDGIADQPFDTAFAVNGVDVYGGRQNHGIGIRIIREHFRFRIPDGSERRDIYPRAGFAVCDFVCDAVVSVSDFARRAVYGKRYRLRPYAAGITEFGGSRARPAVVKRLSGAVQRRQSGYAVTPIQIHFVESVKEIVVGKFAVHCKVIGFVSDYSVMIGIEIYPDFVVCIRRGRNDVSFGHQGIHGVFAQNFAGNSDRGVGLGFDVYAHGDVDGTVVFTVEHPIGFAERNVHL